jgi:hypothetical protein
MLCSFFLVVAVAYICYPPRRYCQAEKAKNLNDAKGKPYALEPLGETRQSASLGMRSDPDIPVDGNLPGGDDDTG